MTAPRWATGVAHVISEDGPKIAVRCPHCGDTHIHPRNFVGSRHVVAGCHAGHSRLREYAVTEPTGARR